MTLIYVMYENCGQGLFQNLAPGGAKVQYQNLRGGIYNYTCLYIPH